MYELLEALIRRRPAVVNNKDLDELLWPNVYVARTSLTQLISELRAVLGDSPRDSRIIRTAYKVGYAFCAEVTGRPAARPTPASIEVLWMKKSFPLVDGDHIAGREVECSLIVDGTTVSRHHARITVAGETATIEDLDSTNGTYVNGTRISTPTGLADGDEFALGGEILKVKRRRRSVLTVAIEDGPKAREKERTK